MSLKIEMAEMEIKRLQEAGRVTTGAQGCFGFRLPRGMLLATAPHMGGPVIGTPCFPSRSVWVPSPQDHAHVLWPAISPGRRPAANLLYGSQGSFQSVWHRAGDQLEGSSLWNLKVSIL